MDHWFEAVVAFVTLLVLPFLGVLGLLKRRAQPWLLGTLAIWLVVGAVALSNDSWTGADRPRWVRIYALGLVLGLAFLTIEKLRRKRAVARWLKLVLAAITLAAFVRALMLFASAYA